MLRRAERSSRYTSAESIGSPANWPHALSAPVLHGSDYHVINLHEMKRAAKDTAKVEGRPSDKCSSMKLGLLDQRPCKSLSSSMQGQMLLYKG